VEPKQYVDISIPAKADDKATDQWVVAQAMTVGGVETFNVVDMALLEAGRVTTASPPCPGVTGQGVYGIYKSKRDVGLNYGEIVHNDVNGGFRLDVEPLGGNILGFASLMPVIVMKQRAPVCFPVLTGNLSIVENTVDLEIAPQEVTPADRAVVVENTTATADPQSGRRPRYSFPRNVLEMAFRVAGTEEDRFEVVVEKTDGSTVVLPSTQIASIRQDAGADTVTIRLNMDKVDVTPKRVTIRNLSVTPVVETAFDQEVTAVRVSVAGAPGDEFRVVAVNADGAEREIQDFERIGTTYPTGNLALRAVSGTIDPTPEQIDEYNSWPPCGPDQPYPCRGEILNRDRGVIRVMVGDESSPNVGSAPANGGTPCGYAVCMEVPLSSIKRGAFAFPFTGDRTHRYGVHVFYKDGKRDYLSISGFKLVVSSLQTGRVVASITAQAPPRRAPQNLGRFSDDVTVPIVVGGPPRFDAYDPSQPLTFTFSEAIDEASARSAILKDKNGNQIPIATVILSPDGKQVTFVPKGSLQLGEDYELDLAGVTDLAGNRLLGRPIQLRTFAPRQLCPSDGECPAVDTGAFRATVIKGADIRFKPGQTRLELEPVQDIQYFRAPDAQQRLRTNLVMTLGGYDQSDYRMATFDVTDPRVPFEMGREYGGRGKRRVELVRGLTDFPVAPGAAPGMPGSTNIFTNPPEDDPCYVPNQRFTGDMAITSSYTPEMSFLTFYNVTDPWKPCTLGEKLLTASPFALNDFNRKGSIHASGFARGIVPMRRDGAISVFTAVQEVGVTRTDLAQNIPSRYPASRLMDPVYSGDVIDIAGFRDSLLVARRDGPLFEVLDVNLNRLASIDLPERPVRIQTAEAFAVDANRDGAITQSELKNLAFVATDSCSWGAASPSQGAPGCSGHIQVVDITTIGNPQIIGRYTLPGAVLSMDIDAPRQRLVVGSALWQQFGARQAVFTIDISKPDETAAPDTNADGWDDRIVWRHNYIDARPNSVRIDKERGVLYVGLAYSTSTGLERGAIDIWALFDDCCDLGVDFIREAAVETRVGESKNLIAREKEALRAGINAALSEAAAKWGSISGLAIMEQGSGACIWRTESGDCDGTYQPGISDHDFEVFFPNLQPDDPAPLSLAVNCTIAQLNYVFTKPIALASGESFEFDDVTFYPVSMAEYLRGFLGVQPAKGIDPAACGINEPAAGSDPGGDLGMGRQQLLMKWLLEGQYVTGVNGLVMPDKQAIYNRLKLGSGLGTKGIPELEGYEWTKLMMYNLAKAKVYIRVKGAAEPESAFHPLFQKQLHDAGKIGIRAALARMVTRTAANAQLLKEVNPVSFGAACLDIREGVASSQWSRSPCTSFEQYVATAAKQTGIFDETTVQMIGRFYRVKSDKEKILTEGAADRFVADVDNFVTQTEADPLVRSTYMNGMNVDRFAGQRLSNMTAVQNKTHEALTKAKIELTPRIFNHGFRNASDVRLVMYRNGGSSSFSQIKELEVSLTGGETRVIRVPADAGTPLSERNLNDISDVDPPGPGNKPHFYLGAGDAGNPAIDQSANVAVQQTVVFTLDLPTLTGDRGHRMKEPDRQNNYGGFHFYILDRASASAPPNAPVPMPHSDPTALKPDAECFTSPQLRVTSQEISYANNKLKLRLLNTSNETISHIQVCSDLAGVCVRADDILAERTGEIEVSFNPPSAAGTFGSNVTVYGQTASGQNVKLTWSAQLTSAGSPFEIKAYDNTPLRDVAHPFSRYTANHDTFGNEAELVGAAADGTEKAVRFRISKLKPGVEARIRVIEPDNKTVVRGNGHIDTVPERAPNLAHVTELTLTPDLSGTAEIDYTPPDSFVREGSDFENRDFNRIERPVRIEVVQDSVGTSVFDLSLRRPPVFLAHGLFGSIDVWKDFQPLVPFTPPVGLLQQTQNYFGFNQSSAQKYVRTPGYDGRFDLFFVGEDHATGRFAAGAQTLLADIAFSLHNFQPRWAIGKFDLIGHSMGGVLGRKLTNHPDPRIPEAFRKLILINSPQGGSTLADAIHEEARKLPLKIEASEAFDLIGSDPGDVLRSRPDAASLIKVEWCSTILNDVSVLGGGYFNVHGGGVDDLRTRLKDDDGNPTEIARIALGEWTVPTHHMVTTTTAPSSGTLGNSLEVSGLWIGLGQFCNLTPTADTVDTTKLLQTGAEMLKTVAAGAKALRAAGPSGLGKWRNSARGKQLLDLAEGGIRKSVADVFGLGDDPKIVFDGPNDRVVPLWSQLGDANDPTLPDGPLNLFHKAVSLVSGITDHQAAKITPNVSEPICKVVDPRTGVVSFYTDARDDWNGDGKPDPTCRVMDLLEADPKSNQFIKTTGGEQ
jgi:pimeloyl-ACP methyl ester carboxylesterase